MPVLTDLQLLWPSGRLCPTGPVVAGTAAQRAAVAEEIEAFFRARWHVDTLILPSARAALGLVIKQAGLNRSRRVFAHRWSPHCVWGVVTPYAAPSTILDDQCDLALVHHMFGYVERFERSYSGMVVEDSCDSLVVDGSALFPNAGQFEVFSLTKILGISTGGLLVARVPGALDAMRGVARDFTDLTLHQARLRREEAQGDPRGFPTWEHLEYQNFGLDLGSLQHVADHLARFDENAATLRHRLHEVQTHHPELWRCARPVAAGSRLPSQLAVPLEHFTGTPACRFLTRHMNRSGHVDAEEFGPFGLLPLHFGVPDDVFSDMLSVLGAACCRQATR